MTKRVECRVATQELYRCGGWFDGEEEKEEEQISLLVYCYTQKCGAKEPFQSNKVKGGNMHHHRHQAGSFYYLGHAATTTAKWLAGLSGTEEEVVVATLTHI